jgi:transposase
MKNQADFVPFQVHRKPILIIKQLLNARAILLGTRVKLLVQIKELERIDKLLANEIKVNLKKSLQALATDIKKIEGRIKKIIQEDEAVKKLHDLILTVPGVGLITFCYLLYFTNEFKQYSGAKQLACYCGVVPFEHTSGTSVKGKPRVHSMANKNMKKLLHTAALSTIIYYDEFKNYYKRKQAEGKNNMLILKQH